MGSTSQFARTIFGLAVLAVGIQHFILDYYTIEKPPLTSLPALVFRVIGFFYTMGLTTLAIAIIFNYKIRSASFALGALIFAWTLFRHLPLVIVNITDPAELNSMLMALAVAGTAFIITASIHAGPIPIGRYFFVAHSVVKLLGNVFYGVAMVVFGVQHVLYASFIASLIPAWISGNYFWAHATGLALIAAGISIAINWKSKWSSLLLGVMISLWIFLIHIPGIVASPEDHHEWTSLFQALIIATGAFVLQEKLTAITAYEETISQRTAPLKSKAKKQWHQRDPAIKRF